MSIDIEKEIREYIQLLFHLSLATVRDNRPWVCEVHFAYDEDLNLYFRSKPGRRHSLEIANNPSVAGNIVRQFTREDQVVGVYFEGEARMLEVGEERMKAFECIKERLQADESILKEADREDGHKFYKITIENWYVFGKFGAESGQKLQLAWNGGR